MVIKCTKDYKGTCNSGKLCVLRHDDSTMSQFISHRMNFCDWSVSLFLFSCTNNVCNANRCVCLPHSIRKCPSTMAHNGADPPSIMFVECSITRALPTHCRFGILTRLVGGNEFVTKKFYTFETGILLNI